MIAAAVRCGTELDITDCGNEDWNEFVVYEIEKAGARIDNLHIKGSTNFCRLIAKAKSVTFRNVYSLELKELKQVIETYSEFPHLKII